MNPISTVSEKKSVDLAVITNLKESDIKSVSYELGVAFGGIVEG
jgi:hypothetical protein